MEVACVIERGLCIVKLISREYIDGKTIACGLFVTGSTPQSMMVGPFGFAFQVGPVLTFFDLKKDKTSFYIIKW
jgi:hypothetical protein